MGLKELIDKRKDILLAEIGALIHDLGKLSEEFVDHYLLDSDKLWDGDYHPYILVPNRFSFDEHFNALWSEYSQGNFVEVENGILNLFLQTEPVLNSLKRELQKRIKLEKKGKIKTLAQIKSALSHAGKPYSNSYLGQKIDEISDRILKPLMTIQLCFNNADKTQYFLKEQLKELLNSIFTTLFNEDLTLANFICEHSSSDTPSKTLSHLIAKKDGTDGIDSAIDKMVSEDCRYVMQSKDHTYIANAFGYEGQGQRIDLSLSDSDEKSLTKIRENYANKLASILNILTANQTSISTWIEKRKDLLNETRKAFLNALGETRRPANDVTLWDHSYSVASLYKAALSQVLIYGWKEPEKIKWRLLAIRFNGAKFYNQVSKIGDVLGRKGLVKKLLDTIRDILEVLIPIGNEIYRDEHGSVFLVPEGVEENNILEITEDIWNSIKGIQLKSMLDFKGNWQEQSLENIFNHKPVNMKQMIKNLCSFISEGLLKPEVKLFASSRGALNLNDAVEFKPDPKPDISRLKEKWRDKTAGYEKCSACGLRPIPLTREEYYLLKDKEWENLSEKEKNNIKAYERKVCLDCLKLMQNRVKEWANDENKKWSKEELERPSWDTSIWLDEVADENNRLALVYISFDLSRWLSGEMLNTFLSKPLLDETFKKEFGELENVTDYNQLVDLIKEAFEKDDFGHQSSVAKKDGNNLTVEELFKVLLGIRKDKNLQKQTKCNKPHELFQVIVEEREPDWENKYPCPLCVTKGDNKHKALVFLLHLTRKHPSFARLRRIWETTRNFGIEMFESATNKIEKRDRTVITFSARSQKFRKTHTYWFKDNKGAKCELVVLPEENGSQMKAAIITASDDLNLTAGDRLELYDENFTTYYDTITVKRKSEEEHFIPIIPYLFEPSKTMFFVPLKNVWEIITHIKKKYEIKFNKVQNRLLIRLGFVAFHKRTPMYVVLDAAEKLCSGEVQSEKLEICDISKMDSRKVVKLKLSDGYDYDFYHATGPFDKEDPGDPNKEDFFYPYFIVENDNGWKVYVKEKDDRGSWETIKHVTYLTKGDKVRFYPSYFDFIWIDTNVRRLDAGSSKQERRHWLFKKASPKPYKLKAIEDFERLRKLLINKLHLTSSQLLNAYGFLISKLQEWNLEDSALPIDDPIFVGFVENIILNIPFRLKVGEETKRGAITREDFEFFKNTMLNGIFFDFIDMWHTVLKRGFKEGG